MCYFYHASKLEFKEGDSFSTKNFNGDVTTDHAKRSLEEQKVNILMDALRPEGVDSRVKSIFLFKKIEHCLAYIKSQKEQLFIYEVNPLSPYFGGFPFCLVNKVYNAPAMDLKEKIIKEYWEPSQKWKFNEYLTQSIQIIEKKEYTYLYCDDFCDDIKIYNRMFCKEIF